MNAGVTDGVTARARRYVPLGCLAGFLIILIIAYLAGPWRHAATTPVQVRLSAPASTQMEICWDTARSECVPLVAEPESAASPQPLWLAELPPRTQYDVSLVFPSGIEHGVLTELTLINSSRLSRPYFRGTADADEEWLTAEGIEITRESDGIRLSGNPGGRLVLTRPVTPCRHSPWRDCRSTLFTILGLVGIAALLIVPLFGRQDGVPLERKCSGPEIRRLVLWCAAASVLHLLVVLSSPVVFASGDSTSYLLKAVSLAEHGTFDTGGYEYEINRTPGYPAFVAAIFRVFGPHLTMVALVQWLLFCSSITLLALSLTSLVPLRWLIPASFLAILSPAQIWNVRCLLTESTFTSAAALSMAAWFQHLRSAGWRSWVWLGVFALLTSVTCYIRPNGVILWAAVVPVYVPGLLARIAPSNSWRATLLPALRYSCPYILAGMVVVLAIGAWSLRNYSSRMYFGFTDIGGIARTVGLTGSGIFDARSLIPLNAYEAYAIGRYRTNYRYPMWYIRKKLYFDMSENGMKPPADAVPRLDAQVRQFTRDSIRRVPLSAHIAATLRLLNWSFLFPAITTYDQEPIRGNYARFRNYADIHALRSGEIAYCSPNLVYDERRENWLFDRFADVVPVYEKGYYVFLVAAYLSAVVLSFGRKGALAAPMWVFLANLVLIASLLNTNARYIQVLDWLLFYQCALVLSARPVKAEAAIPEPAGAK